MADMVSSAVAQEAVHQILSCIKERYEGNSDDARGLMERMEMAHIRLEATLETSGKWEVTSAPLLRWQSKLKGAAEECDHTLRRWKRRLQEDEETEHRLSNSSYPARIAHAAGSLVASIFRVRGSSSGNSSDEPSRSTVRRFEWFAEGAGEFLRTVESGGGAVRRRCVSFSDPLLRHLLAGEGAKYCAIRGSQHLMFLIRPFSHPEHGIQGRVKFLLQDSDAPENSFHLDLHLRLSESTDIVGAIVRCMQLFTPHLRSTAETVRTKLTHLPMQDFFWVPNHSICRQMEHWDRLHAVLYQWFRPNPLCCQEQRQGRHHAGSSTSSLPEPFQCDVYLEPVTVVYLQGHLALSAEQSRGRSTAAVAGGETCPTTRDFPFLKLEGIFSPHASFEDLSPAVVGGSGTEVKINGVQHSLYENVSFEQLGEIILPKTVDCIRGNAAEAATTSHQMLWKSKHGGAYIRIEETTTSTSWRWRATSRRNRGRRRSTGGIGRFVGSCAVQAPVQLQGSIADWVKKQKRMPLCWDSCFH